MELKKNIFKIYKTIYEKGFWDAILILIFDLFINIRFGLGDFKQISLSVFDFNSQNKSKGNPYQITHFYYFFLAMKHVPTKLNNMSFIDLGSGKGGALLMAVIYRFNKIIGIEFVPELVRICRINIRNKLSSEEQNKITIFNIDVVDYLFEDIPTVIFLFNPFKDDILKLVLDNIDKSIEKSELFIVYINPVHIDLFYLYKYKVEYMYNSKTKIELAILRKRINE